ncbi:hypothetical protein WR25_07184 [Diploscapter pachys]|uniref:Lipoprotein n=1 Tax=Diploscapter pachys TaxID=2018661 RepID=A0A2A2LMZ5_9BILA|nr:hypothetical protein WR25_07184 [Diploscapter pachys]
MISINFRLSNRIILIFILLNLVECVPIENKETSDKVQVSGAFLVAGKGEEITQGGVIGNMEDHPIFKTDAFKIAQQFLNRQIEEERKAKLLASA